VGDDRWTAHVSDRWCIGDNSNGGYLVAIAVRAMLQRSPHADPISVTTHFMRPGSGGGPADVSTEILRSGRTLTTARAIVSQNGSARLEVLAAFSDLPAASSGESSQTHSLTSPMPVIPPPDQCVLRSGEEQGIELPILDRLDVMIHPGQARAKQAGRAEVSGWIRHADGAEPDPLSLLVFADAFPPSLFGLLGVVGWVPSVELTVHVRRRPQPGWILGRFTTTDLHDGRMIEDGTLWDESGALVAQSRQIALLLTS
jgi:acyl-CoA thioesterase